MIETSEQIVPEYDLENKSTWVALEAPPVDPAWTRALKELGGLNPFGEPNLRVVWGATHRDEMSVDDGLKYWLCDTEPTLIGHAFTDPVTGLDLMVQKLEEIPRSVLISIPKYGSIALGERRWLVEQWRSPSFLERSNRYKPTMLVDPDDVQDFRVCHNCEHDVEPKFSQCQRCGSTRIVNRTIRTEGEGKLLRDFPRRGCYDFFLRLENAEGKYMPLDGNALSKVRELWAYQHNKSLAEKMADTDATTAPQRSTNARATNPSNPFLAPM